MKPRTALDASAAPIAPDEDVIMGRGAGVGADVHAANPANATTVVITFLTEPPSDLSPEPET